MRVALQAHPRLRGYLLEIKDLPVRLELSPTGVETECWRHLLAQAETPRVLEITFWCVLGH